MSTETARNKAAERLHYEMAYDVDHGDMTPSRRNWYVNEIHAALAAERRATVKRIRGRVEGITLVQTGTGAPVSESAVWAMRQAVRAILDREAG